MGYESKIFIVDKSTLADEDNKYYGNVICMFDLCRMYNDFPTSVFTKETDCYIYEGDKKITKDKYEDTLKEASIQDVIKYIKNKRREGEKYRRLKPCLSMLQGFSKAEREFEGNLVVLHYGY